MKIHAFSLMLLMFFSLAFAKGKPEFDPKICWDHVIAEYNSWRNGCKGKITEPGDICSEALVPLTEDESRQYQAWLKAKQPLTPCQKQKQ